jgi:hypothetical protein
MDSLHEAIALGTTNSQTYYGLALAHSLAGNWQQARTFARAARRFRKD